jgi:hypothetical protein
MRLSDVMSHMNLAMFPEIALLIFLAVFIAVTLKLYINRGTDFDRLAALPLDDSPATAASNEGERHG